MHVLCESANFKAQILALLTKRKETKTRRTEESKSRRCAKVRASKISFSGAPNESKIEEGRVSDKGINGEYTFSSKR